MMESIEVNLKSVSLTLLVIYVLSTLSFCIVFIKAIFVFPTLRQKIWHGITNGDMIPHQDDFQRTAQLFWGFIFGNGLVCCFFLWAAFPANNYEWHFITAGVSAVFLACVGLRSLGGKHN